MVGGDLSQHNQIPHWKIIISQSFSHRSESSEPHIRLPSLGAWRWAEDPSGIWRFEGQWGFSTAAPQDWGKQRLHSWRAHTRFNVQWGPGQSSDSTGAWARPTCASWRVSWGEGIGGGSLWGQGHWWWTPQGIPIGVSSPGGRQFGTETWPHPTTCRLQCWDTSGQTTNRVGTEPHPSADRLPKVILSQQLPIFIYRLTWPCP